MKILAFERELPNATAEAFRIMAELECDHVIVWAAAISVIEVGRYLPFHQRKSS